MKKYKKLLERVETLESVIDVILKENIYISLPVVGGGDDGGIQKVPLKVVLGDLMKKLNIRPTFKREINFIDSNQKEVIK